MRVKIFSRRFAATPALAFGGWEGAGRRSGIDPTSSRFDAGLGAGQVKGSIERYCVVGAPTGADIDDHQPDIAHDRSCKAAPGEVNPNYGVRPR